MNLFTATYMKRQGKLLRLSFPFNSRQIFCFLLMFTLCGLENTQLVNASTPQQTKKTRKRRVATRKTTSKKHIPTFDEYLKEHGAKEPELNLEGIDLDSLDLSPITNEKANWVEAASSDNYLILYSPKRLVRLSKNTIRVWTKRQQIGTDKTNEGFTLELNEYNCETKMSRTIAMAKYDALGNRIINRFTLTHASMPDAEWDYVIPDTLEEDELVTICKSSK